MWILILTLTMAGSQKGGAAVTAVPGFTTEATCMAAANTWLRQPHAAAYGGEAVSKSALCAKA